MLCAPDITEGLCLCVGGGGVMKKPGGGCGVNDLSIVHGKIIGGDKVNS